MNMMFTNLIYTLKVHSTTTIHEVTLKMFNVML